MLDKYYKEFANSKYMAKFSATMSDTHLWAFNRESVARGIALGLACSWIPLPFHTCIAVFLAVLIDCNIPLVIGSIWFANPITMPFMYYFAYELGAKILHVHKLNLHFHVSMQDVLKILHLIWEPFLLGCLICGLAFGLVAYLSIRLCWPLLGSRFQENA